MIGISGTSNRDKWYEPARPGTYLELPPLMPHRFDLDANKTITLYNPMDERGRACVPMALALVRPLTYATVAVAGIAVLSALAAQWQPSRCEAFRAWRLKRVWRVMGPRSAL